MFSVIFLHSFSGHLTDQSARKTGSLIFLFTLSSRGRVLLVTRLSALALFYRQSNGTWREGGSKMVIMRPENMWPKCEVREAQSHFSLGDDFGEAHKALVCLCSYPLLLGPLPNTGSSTADCAQRVHTSKGHWGSSWPLLSTCLAHSA